MSERNEHGERRQGEGVRIIGPEEAQAALEAGAAAGRRPDDELRFGDVPPQPSGPRPPHRFPLPDSVDPAGAVPRPPVVPPARVDPHLPARARHDVGEPGRDAAPGEHAADAFAVTGEHAVLDLTEPAPNLGEGASPPSGVRIAAPLAGEVEAPMPGDNAARAADVDAPAEADDAGPDAPSADHASGTGAGGRPAEPEWLARARAPWPEPTSPPRADLGEPLADLGALWDRGPATTGEHHAVTGPLPRVDADPDALRPLRRAEPAAQAPDHDGAAAGPDHPVAAHGDPTVPLAAPRHDPPPVEPQVAAIRADPPAHPAPPTGRRSRRRPTLTRRPQPGAASTQTDRDEGTTVSGTDLPHWTDPPTGEVPRILADRAASAPRDDDLDAWEALGSRTTTWRDDTTGWDHVDVGLDDLVGDEAPMGALDTTRSEHSDLFSFDADFERLEEERSGQHRNMAAEVADFGDEGFDDIDEEEAPAPLRVGSRPEARARRSGPQPRRRRAPGGPERPTGGRSGGADLGSRLVVGVGLVVLLLIASAVGPAALVVLATAVIGVAGAEVFGILRPIGFKPATLLGLAGIVGVVLAAYWRGTAALPLVTVLVFAGSMCWYLFKVVDARPLANAAVTTLGFAWVGLLGSYASLLLRQPHGRGLFLGALVPAVADDIVAYFTGRQVGSRPLAPSISPGKTWEGAIGGGVAAVVAGLVIGHSVAPWGGLKHGLVLGLVVAVLAPIGDLFESMVKRDLAVKDSGTVLSGHGGVLDRFDAVLIVLPAAYYLASWWHVVR